MPLRKRKPTSPGRRFQTVSDFQDITSQLFPTRVGGFTLKALTSLGEDANGEIYLVDTDLSGGSTGSVYKIVPVR